jgi:predicted enzyme related to lactoylglutathione lyase
VSDSRLVFVALRVRDVEAAARLYRDAFGIPVHEGQPPQPHAEISWTEGAYLHFALFPAGDGPPTANTQVGFSVEDIEAAHVRAAAAGASVVYAPRDEPWGRTAAYRDLDGTLVTLTQRARPLRVAGVDIAGGGWAVVVLEGDNVVEAYRCESFAQALRTDVEVIAVDVPIGIPESGSRPADEAARRFIGSRASSVFSTPIRAILETPTYEKARKTALELTGKSVPKQAYSLSRYIL